MAPEQLWILNPRKLLSRQIDPVPSTSAEKVQFLILIDPFNILIIISFGSRKRLLRKVNHFFLAKIVGFATIPKNQNL